MMVDSCILKCSRRAVRVTCTHKLILHYMPVDQILFTAESEHYLQLCWVDQCITNVQKSAMTANAMRWPCTCAQHFFEPCFRAPACFCRFCPCLGISSIIGCTASTTIVGAVARLLQLGGSKSVMLLWNVELPKLWKFSLGRRCACMSKPAWTLALHLPAGPRDDRSLPTRPDHTRLRSSAEVSQISHKPMLHPPQQHASQPSIHAKGSHPDVKELLMFC